MGLPFEKSLFRLQITKTLLVRQAIKFPDGNSHTIKAVQVYGRRVSILATLKMQVTSALSASRLVKEERLCWIYPHNINFHVPENLLGSTWKFEFELELAGSANFYEGLFRGSLYQKRLLALLFSSVISKVMGFRSPVNYIYIWWCWPPAGGIDEYQH